MTAERWGDVPHGWTLSSGPMAPDGTSPITLTRPDGQGHTTTIMSLGVTGYAARRRAAILELKAALGCPS